MCGRIFQDLVQIWVIKSGEKVKKVKVKHFTLKVKKSSTKKVIFLTFKFRNYCFLGLLVIFSEDITSLKSTGWSKTG